MIYTQNNIYSIQRYTPEPEVDFKTNVWDKDALGRVCKRWMAFSKITETNFQISANVTNKVPILSVN